MANRLEIAVVGASVRAAAFSLLRSGQQPLAADCFCDADLARQCAATQITGYPNQLESWLKEQVRSRPGLVWCYTGALENQPQLVDRMARIAKLAGNHGEQLRAVRSPHKLAPALAEQDLKFPETRSSGEQLPLDGSWLVKTYRGACGSGVAELREQPLPRDVVFQRRISGTPCAAIFVGNGQSAACLGVTRQLVGEAWTGGGRFQYAGSVGPLDLSHSIRAEVEKTGNALTHAFRLQGLFGVDFILDGSNMWTVEVNPRYTASVEVLEAASGISAMDWHLDACRGRLCTNDDKGGRRSRQRFGKAILFARESCQIGEQLATRMLGASSLQASAGWGDVPRGGTEIQAGQPLATAFAAAESCDAVIARLQQQVVELRRQITPAEILPCE